MSYIVDLDDKSSLLPPSQVRAELFSRGGFHSGRLPKTSKSDADRSEQRRLISRTRAHKFNVTSSSPPSSFLSSSARFSSLYHYLLDVSFGKLILMLTFFYITIHCVFAALYYFDAEGLAIVVTEFSAFTLFAECFFFSIQTGETIGYGFYRPQTIYTNIIVSIQAYYSLIQTAVVTGFFLHKIARPSKITRMIIFSDVAVVNNKQLTYVGGADLLDKGYYTRRQPHQTIFMRCANLKKAQMCETAVHLMLLREETKSGKPWTNSAGRVGDGVWRMHELDFELNYQRGRVRGANLSLPLLPLPWTIQHTVNEYSPLFNAMNRKTWSSSQAELILVVEGIDESVSDNYQARFSYTLDDLVFNARFDEIVYHDGKRFNIDYQHLSSWSSVNDDDDDDEEEEEEEESDDDTKKKKKTTPKKRQRKGQEEVEGGTGGDGDGGDNDMKFGSINR